MVGQVLKWNGTAWEPAQDTVAPAAAPAPLIKTFFATAPDGNGTGAQISNTTPDVQFSTLRQVINLDKPSRLVINATVLIFGPNCPLGCSNGQGRLFMKQGNSPISAGDTYFSVSNGSNITVSINNYMIERAAGTYVFDFWIDRASNSSSPFEYHANYSSVVVYPLP